MTSEEAPQYLDGLKAQMEVAQAILNGLGYAGAHFKLLRADSPQELDLGLQALAQTRQQTPAAAARFAVAAEKRSTLELALDHLVEHAPARPEAIDLPAGSPFGSIQVDKDKCTLCLSCVSACPASALQDNPQLPAAALHREELRAVRPVRHHLPGGRDHAAAPPAAHARAQGSAGAQRDASPTPAFAAASRSARSRPSSPCWASWPAIRCSRARRWSA